MKKKQTTDTRITTSPWELGGLTMAELASHTWKSFNHDDGLDVAAALGYYFLLALFPMLIFLMSLLGLLTTPSLMHSILAQLHTTMPPDAFDLIQKEMVNVMTQSKGGLLTIGAVGTFWAASSGVTSLMDGLNRAYEVQETRGFVKRRLIALAMTVGLAMLTIAGAAMLVASDQIAKLLVNLTNLEVLRTVGTIASFLIGLVFMFVGFEAVFYFGPNVKGQKWSWISPGSVVSVLAFVIVSFGFSIYLRFSTSYNVMYGSIGGVVVLMLWLYILGLAIVFGGEVNSEIAKAALERGNNDAPKVAEEGDNVGLQKFDDEHQMASDSNVRKNNVRKPLGYTPLLGSQRNHFSAQSRARTAERHLKALNESNEPKSVTSILKRPLISLVYLGSIGYYLYSAISKRVRIHPDVMPLKE